MWCGIHHFADEAQCPQDCFGNGFCDNGVCNCFAGFLAPHCEHKIEDIESRPDSLYAQCPHHCSNKGYCENGRCVCQPGFAQPDCAKYIGGFGYIRFDDLLIFLSLVKCFHANTNRYLFLFHCLCQMMFRQFKLRRLLRSELYRQNYLFVNPHKRLSAMTRC